MKTVVIPDYTPTVRGVSAGWPEWLRGGTRGAVPPWKSGTSRRGTHISIPFCQAKSSSESSSARSFSTICMCEYGPHCCPRLKMYNCITLHSTQ